MSEAHDNPPPPDFRVLVTGDRNWRCRAVAREVVARLAVKHGPALVVIHGATPGVDTAFAEACELADVRAEAHLARLGLGKTAGPRRNAEMVASGIDLAIACHKSLSRSKGTQDCVRRCLDAGVPVWLVDSDALPVRPRRIREV